MSIAVIGAGAFGTALAIALSANGDHVTLWARDHDAVAQMQSARENTRRLAGVQFPGSLVITADIADAFACDVLLLAIPAQTLRGFLKEHAIGLRGKSLVSCCKGIDIETGDGPADLIARFVPQSTPAALTGPSFASDIARGLPTALTLACAQEAAGEMLQAVLSTATIRLYRTTDIAGAQLGGAIKNVLAIACGACMGAGFGESARAALMTRGFAEMQRLAAAFDAHPDTLVGLSGFGDLALTCTSDQSRNYRYGFALGKAADFDASTTVEGAATAKAVSKLAKKLNIDLPICAVVNGLVSTGMTAMQAMQTLLSRPLKEE